MARVSLLALCTFLAGAATACSSGAAADSADAGPTTPATALCATDSGAQTFTPGLEGTGTTGTLDFKLATIAPSPPIKGNNEWVVTVSDALGNPVDGLTLGVTPYMPAHKHGPSIVPTVTPLGSGKYDVTLIDLFMPGTWTVTFSAQSDGGVDASTVFTFCVDG